MMKKQKIRTMQTHIKQRTVPQDRAADICGQHGDYLCAKTVVRIAARHKTTS